MLFISFAGVEVEGEGRGGEEKRRVESPWIVRVYCCFSDVVFAFMTGECCLLKYRASHSRPCSHVKNRIKNGVDVIFFIYHVFSFYLPRRRSGYHHNDL